MQLIIDLPLSDIDREVLFRLLLDGSPADSHPHSGAQAPAEDEKPSETPSETSETPSETSETPSGLDSDLLEEAITKATAMVRTKNKAKIDKVRAALEEAGVAKVTLLDNTPAVQRFLEAIS